MKCITTFFFYSTWERNAWWPHILVQSQQHFIKAAINGCLHVQPWKTNTTFFKFVVETITNVIHLGSKHKDGDSAKQGSLGLFPEMRMCGHIYPGLVPGRADNQNKKALVKDDIYGEMMNEEYMWNYKPNCGKFGKENNMSSTSSHLVFSLSLF